MPQSEDERREALAALEHEQWAHWTRYMLGVLAPVIESVGSRYFSEEPNPMLAVERWQRQIDTPYAELLESEKASDREWADKVLALLDPSGAPEPVAPRAAPQSINPRLIQPGARVVNPNGVVFEVRQVYFAGATGHPRASVELVGPSGFADIVSFKTFAKFFAPYRPPSGS